MPINYGDAPEQRSGELIPDGTFVRLVLNIRAGGVSLPPSGDPQQDAADVGLFTNSKSSDAVGLDCEFTVEGGEYDRRKIYQWQTVAGGSLDDRGNSKGWNMTKITHRAMIDSAMGLDPADKSHAANVARTIPYFAALNGIGFWAKIGVEPGGPVMQNGVDTGRRYDDKNIIERIVVPGDPEYNDLRAGKPVPPKPKHATHVAGAPAATATTMKPAWGGNAGARQASPPAQAPLPGTGSPAQAPAAAAPSPGQAPAAKPAWLNR